MNTHLLRTFVAKWQPKPVTRPMFLIRCHEGVKHKENAAVAGQKRDGKYFQVVLISFVFMQLQRQSLPAFAAG